MTTERPEPRSVETDPEIDGEEFEPGVDLAELPEEYEPETDVEEPVREASPADVAEQLIEVPGLEEEGVEEEAEPAEY